MLVFNDDQIKNMSKDALLLPAIINDPATGLIAQKQAVLTTEENLKKTDEGQKVFSDFYIDVTSKYHAELALLSNQKRANYNGENIDLAGKSTGPHYPTNPAWTSFTPKLIDSVIGLPVTTLTETIEADYSNQINDLISILKFGYSDNSFSANVGISATSFTINNSISGLANGNRIAISGSGFFMAKVTNIAATTVVNPQTQVSTTTTVVTFSVLYGTAFTGSATVVASLPGFNELQRTAQSSTSPNTSTYNSVTSLLISAIGNWKNYIISLKNIIDSNGDLPPRKAANIATSGHHQTAINTLSNWQSLLGGVGGKFSDSGLKTVTDMIATRATQISTRIPQIISGLGTISQGNDGTYTASGAYGELFKTIDLRAAKGSGTLSAANSATLGLSFFDKRISAANDQLTQYNNTLLIIKLTADTTVGQIDLPLESVNNLVIGDTVKIMDNESAVYSRTISAILPGNTIRLNTGIPSILATSNLARVTRQQ